MATDPYAAPRARVADRPDPAAEGVFLPDGQAVAAIQGWNWIVEGWRLFTRQPGTWVLVALVFGIIVVVLAVIPVIGVLALMVLLPVFVAGFMLACRDLEAGGELGLGHLFAGFRTNAGRLAVVGLLSLAAYVVLGLIVVAAFWAPLFGASGAFGAGGDKALFSAVRTMLLLGLTVLALSVPIYMALWFAPVLVALNDFGAGDALKASFRASLKNIVPFLLYGVIMFAFSLLVGITYGLGWLVLGPVLAGSVYAGYRDIYYAR
ncbi:MAG: BPSS1780 family membrane protein [Gemmatimonadales bacterium]